MSRSATPLLRSDAGSTSVAAMMIAAAAFALVAGLGLGGRAFLIHAQAAGTADLAALAAADAARGIAPGDPCEAAAATAAKADLKVTECIARSDLGAATVTVSAPLPAPLPAIKVKAVAGSSGGP